MTRTIPELAPLLETKTTHQREGVWSPTYDLTCNRPVYDGSSVESGLEPGTLRPQSRDLATRAPRSHILLRPFSLGLKGESGIVKKASDRDVGTVGMEFPQQIFPKCLRTENLKMNKKIKDN
ncbi:hypothetical protein AVEN_221506-1 [Araneus ventricosus]|uniref:Uncharacterized protein n=1 Tax=Araneus ventricosus TaxID=182803 RepID=A0A4Y2E0C4_ARAVE|nr:hypothetical protein AVEN_221506-1 [Araneus ventricosus]